MEFATYVLIHMVKMCTAWNVLLAACSVAGKVTGLSNVAITSLSSATTTFNGLGEIRYPTIVNLLMLWVVRIPVGYLIDYFFDGTYCMVCFPVSFSFGMLGMFEFFFTKKCREVCKGEGRYTKVKELKQQN